MDTTALTLIAAAVAGYLAGSISGARIVGRLVEGHQSPVVHGPQL